MKAPHTYMYVISLNCFRQQTSQVQECKLHLLADESESPGGTDIYKSDKWTFKDGSAGNYVSHQGHRTAQKTRSHPLTF